jgi:hypothetical protein
MEEYYALTESEIRNIREGLEDLNNFKMIDRKLRMRTLIWQCEKQQTFESRFREYVTEEQK